MDERKAVEGMLGKKIYTLRQEQWIERPRSEVFQFFADARNLEAITPAWLHFTILSMSTGSIEEGTEIRYSLRLHGITFRWRTEICRWNAPHGFVDVQRSGPYKLWHHTHRFEDHGDRTRMVDVVRYTLPLGIVGRVIHRLKVRGDVEKIFAFRRKQIEEYFSPAKLGASARPGPVAVPRRVGV